MILFTDALRSKDEYYMNLARSAAKGSKCIRAKYGTIIIAKDNHTISTGYNGKPAGSCNDLICYRENLPQNAQKENCCVHSEINALMFCSRIERAGGTIYISGVPCKDCALVIMQSGLARVVYQDIETIEGHKGGSDDDFWKKYDVDIEVSRFNPDKWKYRHILLREG